MASPDVPISAARRGTPPTMMAPHLKAIAPGCTDFDKYGFVSRGGITAQFNTRPENPGQDYGQGVVPVTSDTEGKQAAAAIDEHLKGTPMAELLGGMRYRDDVSPLLGVPFWRESSVATYAKADRALRRRPLHLGQLAGRRQLRSDARL